MDLPPHAHAGRQVLDSVYDVKPEQIANGVEMLLDHDEIVVQDADVVKAAVAQYRRHPGLASPTVSFSKSRIPRSWTRTERFRLRSRHGGTGGVFAR